MAALWLILPAAVYTQAGQRGAQAAQTPKTTAAIDITGTWVSVITEDWKYRMVTPRKGDFDGVPGSVEAFRSANAWDPAKDEAAGEQCKSYGAVGGMRLPGYLRISWQDDNTLKMELTAGTQTRLFHFGPAEPPAGQPTRQGYSTAQWEYAITGRGEPRKGDLKIITTHLQPGYSRKNGVPYSANAHLTEYYHRMTAPNGDEWLNVISELRDPQYLSETWVVSSQFKKVPANSRWNPEPCSAR
ncbi:MAG TPA: hypothetical protein VGX03_05510 [Candidatus Binatia bacterium]|jgi:hypothetical protein|nr:hypothetical protein [Candidatus Binatia bacterium]